MTSGSQGNELFISSDMFFLEVILEPSGAVKNVKIHHEGKNEQQVSDSCFLINLSYFSLLSLGKNLIKMSSEFWKPWISFAPWNYLE